MVNKVLNKLPSLKNATEEIKIICLYRYISLILTSIFYLAGDFKTSILRKLIVVGCLSLASYILNYLYIKNQTTKNMLKLIIFMEILGNTAVLIPTGGMDSPYMLYSLNTILITVYYFNIYYCFFNILIYFLFLSGVSFFIMNRQYNNVVNVLRSKSNIILIYILVAVLLRLLFILLKKINVQSNELSTINIQLVEANETINDSLQHIMSLYQATYTFKNINNIDKIINLLVKYTKEITKTPIAFYYTFSGKDKGKIEISQDASVNCRNEVLNYLNREYTNFQKSDVPFNIIINNKEYMIINIKSARTIYGMLGIQINCKKNEIMNMENSEQLIFLSNLSIMTFERIKFDEVNERLLITEEQKRIADELHDSTSQKLFGVSCMINSLIYCLGDISEEKVKSELKLARDTLSDVITELRNTIYNLSWNNRSGSAFQLEVINFIKSISELNDIHILFNLTGNENLLCSDMKKAIFRMICEGTGNAVRHGKCSNVVINLSIDKEYTKLMIKDDGVGFNVKDKISKMDIGLGMKNLHNSVFLLNGKITINSYIEKGTVIDIMLPNRICLNDNTKELLYANTQQM